MGAGKSTVAQVFHKRGAYLIDADQISRDVVAPGSSALAELVTAFSAEILLADGSLNRPRLAEIAFASEESRLKLNAIMHPQVGNRTMELINAAPANSVVLQDIPLLVESGLAPLFHLVIVVDAPVELRISRLVSSRGLDETDARARIKAQATTEQRRAVADAWIDNSGVEAELVFKAEELWDQRIAPYLANVTAHRPASITPIGSDEESLRIVNRVTMLGGAQLAEVKVIDSNLNSLEIIAIDDAAQSTLSQLLPSAGFCAIDSGTDSTDLHFGSADPGRAAKILLTTKE